MKPYERVQLSRKRTCATFPLPGVDDCIRYAICELAEMDDAWLRIDRRDDKRNNAKAHDPAAELGQALYMMLSAAVQLGVEPQADNANLSMVRRMADCYEVVYAHALHQLAGLLSVVMLSAIASEKLQDAFDCAYGAVALTGEWYGWDHAELVDRACAAFEAKHAPEARP